ncbi:hypothetical protein J2X46_003992 [Nocardioides sp. BE266]|uniref:hypothetical protein n=1 Tax=Nocardioides sp. BE266 TaxID=2817725 RepID=UPI00285CDA64|nr:hypothetical protein [Nocardioides sp. BE266]MDR7254990.1 hypothetical protein [Nocardioides sp. BE266]
MSAARWDRLVADLAAAGESAGSIELMAAKVTAKAYSQVEYGRVAQGVSRSIGIGQGEGLVMIRDRYGRGGKWYGYSVCVTQGDHDREVCRSTKRSEVVAAVVKAVAR